MSASQVDANHQAVPDDHTHHFGHALWLVGGTLTLHAGKTEHLRHTLYTEQSARQLVRNLIEQRVDGMSVDEVFTETG